MNINSYFDYPFHRNVQNAQDVNLDDVAIACNEDVSKVELQAILRKFAGTSLEFQCLPLLDRDILLQVANHPTISSLSFQWCQSLTATEMELLFSKSPLRRLMLTGCHNTTINGNEQLPQLAMLKHLEVLSLDWIYSISDVTLQELAGHSRLVALSLFGNEGITDVGVGALGRLPALKILRLPELAKITDLGIGVLAKESKSISALSISDLKVSNAGIDSLSNLSSLENLTINRCKMIKPDAFSSLIHLSRFERLELINMSYSEQEIKSIKNILPHCQVSVESTPVFVIS